MIGNKNSFFNKSTENNFWPSFTDLLSAIILVFLLFLLITMIYYTYEIDRVRGMRKEILEDIANTLVEEGVDVHIDEGTGAIVFKERILFETNKAVIREEFKDDLDRFIPFYARGLLNEDTRKYISEIIIEGHTDARGGFFHNLKLAQDRGYSVAEYILGDDSPDYKYKDDLKDFIIVSGTPDTSKEEVADENKRRVEFKFRLQDESAIRRFEGLFN